MILKIINGGINIKKSMEFDMTRQFSFTVHCFKILYLSFIPAHILKFHFQVIKKTRLNKTKLISKVQGFPLWFSISFKMSAGIRNTYLKS